MWRLPWREKHIIVPPTWYLWGLDVAILMISLRAISLYKNRAISLILKSKLFAWFLKINDSWKIQGKSDCFFLDHPASLNNKMPNLAIRAGMKEAKIAYSLMRDMYIFCNDRYLRTPHRSTKKAFLVVIYIMLLINYWSKNAYNNYYY